MDKASRKAAKAAWAERRANWTIVAVRIGDRAWVTLTPDPAALERRLGFGMRTGAGGAPGMRAAYGEAGAVNVEALERLDTELSPLARERIGKERLAVWRERLGAVAF